MRTATPPQGARAARGRPIEPSASDSRRSNTEADKLGTMKDRAATTESTAPPSRQTPPEDSDDTKDLESLREKTEQALNGAQAAIANLRAIRF